MFHDKNECLKKKKEAEAIAGSLWDCCKDLCNYEVNVDLTLTH